MTTGPKATTNLDTAITTYSDDANDLYNAVHDAAVVVPPILPLTDAAKTAQNQLQSAFTQLTTAASMEADQTDRAGLAAVVQLMQTTADSAKKISTKLEKLLRVAENTTPTTAEYAHINALTSALSVLAQLSPSDVWTTR
jgi:hypothetical protein